MSNGETPPVKDRLEMPVATQKTDTGLTPGLLRVLNKQVIFRCVHYHPNHFLYRKTSGIANISISFMSMPSYTDFFYCETSDDCQTLFASYKALKKENNIK